MNPPTRARRVSAADIADLPADTLPEHMAEIMTGNQHGLAAVVLADAARKAPQSASELLRSPEWAERWLLTLIGLEGALRVATARAEIHNAPGKARSAWQRARQVSNRLIEARALVETHRRARRQAEQQPPAPPTPARAARWALGNLHGDQVTTLRRQVLADAGLAELANPIPTDDETFWAMATRTRLLTPTNEARATRTLNQDWPDFVDQVRDDVANETRTDPSLRDPVIVYMWGQALAQLHREACQLLNLPAGSPGDDFPVLTLNLRSLDTETAERKVRRLRRLAGIRARWMEQQLLLQELKHAAAARLDTILSNATRQAIDHLAEEHAPEYGWLHERMIELADPATGLMPAGWRNRRKQVLADLAERLRRADVPTS